MLILEWDEAIGVGVGVGTNDVDVAAVVGGGGAGLAASETLADTGGGVADFRRAAGDMGLARP